MTNELSSEKRACNVIIPTQGQNKIVKQNKISFPQKIWQLAHQEDTDGFFQWSVNGEWITIERELFEVGKVFMIDG